MTGAERQAKWRASNPERKRALDRASRARHVDNERARGARWREANRATARSAQARRRKERPEDEATRAAQRRQRIAHAVPWLDRDLIRDIYTLARIHREAGINCHVDHVLPLRGKLVSGLHVQSNLSVILAEHNLAKGNAA